MASTLPKIVGKYKVQKRLPNGNGKVGYFLRCLWHLLSDKKSKDIIYWKPDAVDKFVIPEEKNLDKFLKNYDGFKSNMPSFRRSLYFYGFKKMHNVWYHPHINKNNYNSCENVKRKINTKKEKAMKLRNQYFELMFAQMKQMNPNLNPMHMLPHMPKHPLSPTYSGMPYSLPPSSSGTTSHSPENQELSYPTWNPQLMMNPGQMNVQPELVPMMNSGQAAFPQPFYHVPNTDDIFEDNMAVNNIPQADERTEN